MLGDIFYRESSSIPVLFVFEIDGSKESEESGIWAAVEWRVE